MGIKGSEDGSDGFSCLGGKRLLDRRKIVGGNVILELPEFGNVGGRNKVRAASCFLRTRMMVKRRARFSWRVMGELGIRIPPFQIVYGHSSIDWQGFRLEGLP